MKKITSRELRQLVKETIRDLKSETKRHQDVNTSKKERERIVENLINETINAVLLFEEIDDLQMQSDPEQDSEQGSEQQSSDQQSAAQNHPFDNFLTQLLGPNLDGKEGWSMGEHKEKIQELITQQVPGTEHSFGDFVDAGDSDATTVALTKGKKSKPAVEMMASQNAIYLNQSVDGYLTRPKDSFIGGIAKKNVDADDVFFSNDGYIIDGHHRFSSIVGMNPACTVTGVEMNANIEKCLKILNLILETIEKGNGFQASGDPNKSLLAKGKTVTGEDVLGVWKEVVNRTSGFTPKGNGWSAVDAEGDTPEEKTAAALESFRVWCESNMTNAPCGTIEELADYVGKNITSWAQAQDVEQFGAREGMPQIAYTEKDKDGNEVRKNDFTPQVMQVGDGKYDHIPNGKNPLMEESFDLKRWSKLAGLLKD